MSCLPAPVRQVWCPRMVGPLRAFESGLAADAYRLRLRKGAFQVQAKRASMTIPDRIAPIP